MSEMVTIGLNRAKRVLQVQGADETGHAILRKKLSRDQVLPFFSALPPCTVAMKACGGSHFWGREIALLGHVVRMIPPAHVKPFMKRQKNDAAFDRKNCITSDASTSASAATLRMVVAA